MYLEKIVYNYIYNTWNGSHALPSLQLNFFNTIIVLWEVCFFLLNFATIFQQENTTINI